LHSCNNGWGIKPDRLSEVNKFDDVEAPLAALEARDPRLRLFKLFGELNLPNPSVFTLGGYEFHQPLMALAMNGLSHLFEYAELAI